MSPSVCSVIHGIDGYFYVTWLSDYRYRQLTILLMSLLKMDANTVEVNLTFACCFYAVVIAHIHIHDHG